jgi:uncharacterized protein YecE (DUF72 family)
MSEIRIGTSGWLYRHWRGVFYPEGLRQKDELDFYAKRFDTVELNGSFYRLPPPTAISRWGEAAPEGFLYAWKYPRWLTHYYRLKDPDESYKLVFGRMAGLGEALGPCVLQLHPHMTIDRERLATALQRLPKRAPPVAVEFRHQSWFEAPILALLAEHDVALCISDHEDAPSPWATPASWVYIRGHGPFGDYRGAYSRMTLQIWAKRIKAWSREGKSVFCYFDNDADGAAPRNAQELKRMVGRDHGQAR